MSLDEQCTNKCLEINYAKELMLFSLLRKLTDWAATPEFQT